MRKKVILSLPAAALLITVSIWVGFAAEATDNKSTPPGAVQFEWRPDMDCAICHTKQAGSMSADGVLALAHVENGIEQCSDCHDEDRLKKRHARVVPGRPFFIKARKYPKDFCFKCHGSYEELSDRTADSKALTDMNGMVVNPHDVPKNIKHYKTDECYTCHRMHKTKPDIMRYCVGCHHTTEFACGTCHPST